MKPISQPSTVPRAHPQAGDGQSVDEGQSAAEERRVARSSGPLNGSHDLDAVGTESSSESDFQSVLIGMLEERLLRIEDSASFRLNRALGAFLRDQSCRISGLFARLPWRPAARRERRDYARWVRNQDARRRMHASHQYEIETWTSPPSFSFLYVTEGHTAERLQRVMDCLRDQVYGNWQLCISHSGGKESEALDFLRRQSEEQDRIKYKVVARDTPGSACLAEAAAMATGDYVGYLWPGDVLDKEYVYHLAKACWDFGAQIAYCDHDYIDAAGQRMHPCFKPDWSPDLLTSCLYWGRSWVVQRRLLEDVSKGKAWLRQDFEGDELYDLALRLTDKPSVGVRHVPRVLYHQRLKGAASAHSQTSNGAGADAGRLALEDAMRRRGSTASVERGQLPNSYFVRRRLDSPPLVSLIVCSCNARLFERFLRRLKAKTDYDAIELVVMEHQSGSEPFRMARLSEIWKGKLVHIPFVGRFNFATMGNLAAEAATGSVLVFLNDDTEPRDADWLDLLASQIVRPEIGIVGARLLYPNGAVQHAGIAIGMSPEGMGHFGRYSFENSLYPWLSLTRNVSGVTGACFGIRASTFQQLGGFDPRFPLDYNDLDLCLRARENGFSVLLEANAVLYHRESTTRIRVCQFRERSLFYRRWWEVTKQHDPYVPIAFERNTEEIRLCM